MRKALGLSAHVESPGAAPEKVQLTPPVFVCTVIIHVHNELAHIRRCLDMLDPQLSSRRRLVLVDDASDEYTRAYLRDFADRRNFVSLIRFDDPKGAAASYNAGIRVSSSGDIVLLSARALPTVGLIPELAASVYADPDAGLAVPISNTSTDSWIRSRPGDTYRDTAKALAAISFQSDPECPLPEEGCMYVRETALRSVGLFDETYRTQPYAFLDYALRNGAQGKYTVCGCRAYLHHQAAPDLFDEAARADAMELLQRYSPLPERILRNGIQSVLGQVRQALAAKTPRRFMFREDAEGHYHETFSEITRERQFAQTLEEYEQRLRLRLQDKPRKTRQPRIVFLVNRLQRVGGILTVVDIVNDLAMDGRDVQLVVHSPRAYDTAINLMTEPIFFKNRQELIDHFPEADVVVGTFWNTMYAIAKIFAQRGNFTPAYFVQDFEPYFIPEKYAELRALCARTYRLTPHAFAWTPWICDRVRETGGEITLLSPALDLDVFYPRDAAPEPGAKIIATMLRPVTPRRGFATAVEVFRRLAARRNDFVVHSFGCTDAELERHRIAFPCVNHGRVPNDRLPDLYSTAWCFAEFSDFHGLGKTIAEALACGTPAVVTRSGGADSFCADGVNCLTAAPGDVDGLVRQLETMLDNAGLRDSLARNARPSVAGFERRASAKKIFEFLNGIA